MAFQTPITILEALDQIHRRAYVLPAIQREFVWKPEQIVRLFDSLMKDYPIGSFLFWEVQEERRDEFQFYEFLRDYHERDRVHNPKSEPSGDRAVTAVLDGQQRLTSLYIGLYGTYSERLKGRWKKFDSSYPKKRLYLNLTRPAEDYDLDFDFQFMEEDKGGIRDNGDFWFRASDVRTLKSESEVIKYLMRHGLLQDGSEYPVDCLTKMHAVFSKRPLVNYFRETDQDLDKVLNLFIRVNSGGTELSYSDLLLSIATAQFDDIDARDVIYGLVDDLNQIGDGFQFSKDFVLKSCLMLLGIDLRWRVENFTKANMRRIEDQWPDIERALRLGVAFAAQCGFSQKTLPSAYALIPVVHFFFKQGTTAHYLESAAFVAERGALRRWLNIVLLKRVFSGVYDQTLRVTRKAIDEAAPEEGFPFEAIADGLRATPRNLRFEEEEIEALMDVKYGGLYTFSILGLLYPDLDYRNHFHQDHIHPKSHFTNTQLAKNGVPEADREFCKEGRDRLPNLQLLEGISNQEKSNRTFPEWLDSRGLSDEQKRRYAEQNHLPDCDMAFNNFREFYEGRRELLIRRLSEVTRLPGGL